MNSELQGVREQLDRIERRLNAVLDAGCRAIPDDAREAASARAAARMRGFFWTNEFAAVIGRNVQVVVRMCSARVIHVLPGGKPYRIPLTEEDRFNRDGAF